MKKVSLLLVLMLTLVLTVGCGGDDDGGSAGSVKMPVSDDTIMADMSDDEAVKFCESAYSAMMKSMAPILEAAMEMTCSSQGLSAAMTEWAMDGDDDSIQSECEATVNDCKEMMDDAESSGDDEMMTTAEACEDFSADDLADCDAEAGVVGECLNEYMKLLASSADLLDSIPSCSELDADYFDNPPETPDSVETETPKACEDALADCPDLASWLADDNYYYDYGYYYYK
ncbi:MAG: hypothetical protein JXX14_00780 [Deltaproteobacteria bacterium]|nr:hypothetical protein [Deltaproteobacteria bacterium]